MYDRFDLMKGRYVTYEYQPKGDKFSRGLAEMPRAHKLIANSNTGHTYYRRARTDEAQELTVSTFRAMLPKGCGDDLEGRTFYLEDYKHDILPFYPVRLEPPGVPIRLEVTDQHKGKRVWFRCPHCDRRVGKLYRLKAKYHFMRQWGCQKCLGLSYPSQAGHKTRVRDMAITEGRIQASRQEELRAYERECRRMERLSKSIDRMLGHHGLP